MSPEVREAIREARDDLEELAESELPCAAIAQALLNAAATEA